MVSSSHQLSIPVFSVKRKKQASSNTSNIFESLNYSNVTIPLVKSFKSGRVSFEVMCVPQLGVTNFQVFFKPNSFVTISRKVLLSPNLEQLLMLQTLKVLKDSVKQLELELKVKE